MGDRPRRRRAWKVNSRKIQSVAFEAIHALIFRLFTLHEPGSAAAGRSIRVIRDDPRLVPDGPATPLLTRCTEFSRPGVSLSRNIFFPDGGITVSSLTFPPRSLRKSSGRSGTRFESSRVAGLTARDVILNVRTLPTHQGQAMKVMTTTIVGFVKEPRIPWFVLKKLRVLKSEFRQWSYTLLLSMPGRIGIRARRRLLPFAKIGKNVRLDRGSWFEHPENITIGDDTGANRFCFIHAGGGVEIGRNVLLGPFVTIYSQNHNWRDREVCIAD